MIQFQFDGRLTVFPETDVPTDARHYDSFPLTDDVIFQTGALASAHISFWVLTGT